MRDQKMRVYQLDRPGSLDCLVLSERDIPSPAAGELLVRVRASSLNFRDLMIINGQYPMPVPSGRVPLSDGAGEIVVVGAGVTRFKVCDRVIGSGANHIYTTLSSDNSWDDRTEIRSRPVQGTTFRP